MKNKKSLIFFCTHIINKAIISEYKKLESSYPEKFDTILVIDNETTKFSYDYGIYNLNFFGQTVKCLLFDKKLNDYLCLECKSTKGDNFDAAMWYNSDYRYYYVKFLLPSYEYYWYLEYDVFCNGKTYKPFLEKYDNKKEDLLIPHFRKLKENDDWCWIGGSDWIYKGKDLYGSFFPISRLSSKAIDFLYKRRKEHGQIYKNTCVKNTKRKWIFCELFVPTEIINGGFTAEKIEEENIRQQVFDLNIERIFEKQDYKIYHPVKEIKQMEKDKVVKLYEKIKNFICNKFISFKMKIKE